MRGEASNIQHALDPYFSYVKGIIEGKSANKIHEIQEYVKAQKPRNDTDLEKKTL